MKEENKKISICMTTYNGMRFLKEQIDSILNQSVPADEIIIADDCSNDGTLEYIKSINDQRIIIIESKNNLGVIKTIERAIYKATGDYIFLCDQDDVWLQNKIETVISEIDNETNLIVHNAYITSEDTNDIIGEYFVSKKPTDKLLCNLYRNTLIGAMMAFPRSLVSHILPFPDGIGMHDIWIGLISAKKGKIKFIEKPLMYYRRHNMNASPTFKKSKRSIIKRIKERLITAYNLLKY